MVGPDGQTVALRGQLPAVVLLTDGCECAQLIADTTAAVRPDIAVVTVSSGAPRSSGSTPPTGATPQAQGKIVRQLSDPTSTLRLHLKLGPPDGTAAALLVNRGGEIVRTETRAWSVAEDLQARPGPPVSAARPPARGVQKPRARSRRQRKTAPPVSFSADSRM